MKTDDNKDKRRTQNDGNISHGLWPDELKRDKMMIVRFTSSSYRHFK